MYKKIIFITIGVVIISLIIWFLDSQKLTSPSENGQTNNLNNQNLTTDQNQNQDLNINNDNLNSQPLAEFCGWSTKSNCLTNEDCLVDGCSGQVCRAKSDAFIGTTCEWRDCYDVTRYELSCQCINGQCQWN